MNTGQDDFMKKVLLPKEHITDYIPQRNPIVMIDTLNYCEGTITKTSFEVKEDNIFVKEGRFQEPGIIENIAQTAAVKAGYEVKKNGAEPVIGFIGAIKDLIIYRLPEIGDVLETTLTIKMDVMGITLVEGVSSCKGNKIAACEMKIFIQKPEQTNV